jgi:phosphoenolpyruvate synthase/pyruvate phosphate dikinase
VRRSEKISRHLTLAGRPSKRTLWSRLNPDQREGPVRVVHDAAVVEVEPGEVLVAPTTDPSWASIMLVSSALVVDVGRASQPYTAAVNGDGAVDL